MTRLQRVGHHAMGLYGMFAGLNLVFALVAVSWDTTAGGSVLLALFQLMTLLLTLGILWVGVTHDRKHPCPTCRAATPQTLQAQAEHHRATLRRVHQFLRPVVHTPVLLLLLACVLAQWVISNPWGDVAAAVALFPLASLLFADRAHQRLRPWCTGCTVGA